MELNHRLRAAEGGQRLDQLEKSLKTEQDGSSCTTTGTSITTSSPLSSLRGLLSFYALVGIIPGQLSPDGCTFAVRKRNYLRLFGVALALVYAVPVVVNHYVELLFLRHYLGEDEEAWREALDGVCIGKESVHIVY